MNKLRFLLFCTMAVLLTACASSRKAVNEQHHERFDSEAVTVMDSVRQSGVVMDSIRQSETEEKHTSFVISENGSDEETVTEHITETTDSLGNKTVTTDRTIHRKNSHEKQSSTEEWQRRQMDEIRDVLQSINSMEYNLQKNAAVHWAKNDSLDSEKENQGVIERTGSFLHCGIFLCILILAFAVYRKRQA